MDKEDWIPLFCLIFILFLLLIGIAKGEDCLSCHSNIDDYMLEEQTTCNDCHTITNHRTDVCTNCHPLTTSAAYHQLHNKTCDTCHTDAKKAQGSFSMCTTCHTQPIDTIHVSDAEASSVTSGTSSPTNFSSSTYERFTLYSLFQNLWSQLMGKPHL